MNIGLLHEKKHQKIIQLQIYEILEVYLKITQIHDDDALKQYPPKPTFYLVTEDETG